MKTSDFYYLECSLEFRLKLVGAADMLDRRPPDVELKSIEMNAQLGLSDFYYVRRKMSKNSTSSTHWSSHQKRRRVLIQLPQKLVSGGLTYLTQTDLTSGRA